MEGERGGRGETGSRRFTQKEYKRKEREEEARLIERLEEMSEFDAKFDGDNQKGTDDLRNLQAGNGRRRLVWVSTQPGPTIQDSRRTIVTTN